jgi:hypothetical protein
MIQIIKEVSMGHDFYKLFMGDDELTDRVELEFWGGFQGAPVSFDITVRDPEVIERFISHCFYELPEDLDNLNFDAIFNSDLIKGISISQIPASQPAGSSHFAISFNFGPISSNWPRGYSSEEYYNEVRRLVEATNETEIQSKAGYVNRAEFKTKGVYFFIASPHLQIANEISRCSNILREINNVVERTLASRARSDSIVMAFDFPEEVKIPCEQYLLYFVQFLKDLGVEATSELSNKAGQVLFTVTPTDKLDALDKIRTALEIYMCLPASTLVNFSEADKDVVIDKLIENVQYLKSQLVLSYKLLKGREAIIQEQESIIDHQQHLLSGHIIIESLVEEALHSQSEEKEELLGGMVIVTRYKGKGFEINLPKVVRRLRRLFTKEAEEKNNP